MRDMTNEQALDLFADLMEPVAEILTDNEVKKAYNEKPLKGIKVAIKRHKRTLVSCLAMIDGVLGLINSPDMQPIIAELFQLQDQMMAVDASGPATEPTGDGVE